VIVSWETGLGRNLLVTGALDALGLLARVARSSETKMSETEREQR
jgi:hypothetical protein